MNCLEILRKTTCQWWWLFPNVGDYNDNSELEDFNNHEQSLSDGDNDEGINFNISTIENDSEKYCKYY